MDMPNRPKLRSCVYCKKAAHEQNRSLHYASIVSLIALIFCASPGNCGSRRYAPAAPAWSSRFCRYCCR